MHELEVTKKSKKFEQELELRENSRELREKAFHLLEAICPTVPTAAPIS